MDKKKKKKTLVFHKVNKNGSHWFNVKIKKKSLCFTFAMFTYSITRNALLKITFDAGAHTVAIKSECPEQRVRFQLFNCNFIHIVFIVFL